MNSMKAYLTVWFAGLVAGLIMVERWRRAGDRSVPAPERAAEALGTAPASTASTVSPERPTLSSSVVAGAKADAERVLQLLTQRTPWRTIPPASLAQLRRSSHTATPANTPNHPA